VKKILYKDSKRPFNFNRDLGDKPPLAEGVRYQKVIIRDPNGGKCYYQDQFIVETESLPTAGLLLQGSASWSDAAVLAALDEYARSPFFSDSDGCADLLTRFRNRGFVLVPCGLYAQTEWDRCRRLANSGRAAIPVPVTVKDQQHLCRMINIAYYRASHLSRCWCTLISRRLIIISLYYPFSSPFIRPSEFTRLDGTLVLHCITFDTAISSFPSYDTRR